MRGDDAPRVGVFYFVLSLGEDHKKLIKKEKKQELSNETCKVYDLLWLTSPAHSDSLMSGAQF